MSFDAKVIRESFNKAKPAAIELASRFYNNLFTDYPASKELFATVNLDAQKKSLVRALVYIVDHLESPEKLLPYLRGMGARHVGYGASDEHYAWVTASLLKTLAEAFGRLWNADLEANWTAALTVVADTMREGAQSGRKTEHTAAVIPLHGADNLPPVTLPAELVSQIRAAARKAVLEAIQQEIQLAIDDELRTLATGNIRDLMRRQG